MGPWRISSATVSDLPDMLELYRPYVEQTTSSLEYETPSLADWNARFADLLTSFPVLVARDAVSSALVGYAYACPFKPRAGYSWTCESTIYLSRDTPAGTGLGREMYEMLLTAVRRMGFCVVMATITGSNAGSIRFHERLGFIVCGVFRCVGFKHGTWLDVIAMQKVLVPIEELPAVPTKPSRASLLAVTRARM